MVSRLTQIQSMLEDVWGGALQEAAPDLVYQINRILVRFGRTDDTLPALWDQLDSLLFNTVYQVSGREMTLLTPKGSARITEDGIRELADRLLSLVYRDRTPDPLLADALFDLVKVSVGGFPSLLDFVQHHFHPGGARCRCQRGIRQDIEHIHRLLCWQDRLPF